MAALAPPRSRGVARAGATAARAAPTRERPQRPPVQAKLRVSTPDDPQEREAEHTADRVMRMQAPRFPMGAPQDQETLHRAVAPAQSRLESTGAPPAREPREPAVQRAVLPAQTHLESRNEEPGKPALQRAPKEKPKPVQRAKEEPPPVRRAAKDERPPQAQREAAAPGAAGGEAPAGFDAALGHAGQAGGEPLPASTLGLMEQGFGRSFGDVRVHRDGGAASLARDIDARAFTVGNQVYFGAGQYQPHSPQGRHLIAHELTHVVQQGAGGAQRSVQRQPTTQQTAQPVGTGPAPTDTPTPTAEPTHEWDPPPGSTVAGAHISTVPVADKSGTITVPALRVPQAERGMKGASNHANAQLQGRPGEHRNALIASQPYEFLGKTPRGSLSARRTWITAAQGQANFLQELESAVTQRWGSAGTSAGDGAGDAGGAAPADGSGDAALAQGAQSVFYLRPTDRGIPLNVIGTAAEVARHELVLMPTWDRGRAEHAFDVDHLHELQLGGLDAWDNFWILDASANRSSGSLINARLKQDLNAVLNESKRGTFWRTEGKDPPEDADAALANWKIRFTQVSPTLDLAGEPAVFWTREDIRKGAHLGGLRKMSEREIVSAGLRFRPGEQPTALRIFGFAQGGYYKQVQQRNGAWPANVDRFYGGFHLDEMTLEPFDAVQDGRRVGLLRGHAFTRASRERKNFEPPAVEIPLLQSTRLGFGVYTDRDHLYRQLGSLRIKKASPVALDDAGLSADGALYAEGRILTTLPLFSGLEVPFQLRGDSLTLEFPIPANRLRLGPMEVTSASLELGVDAQGLALGGGVNFKVAGLGRGRLEARQGVALPGAAPATPAAADAGAAGDAAAQEESGFALVGTFNFDSDKLDPASIEVRYEHNQFGIDADVGLKPGVVPGLASALIHVRAEAGGVSFQGTATLALAGLRGTQLTVGRTAEGDIDIGADNIPLPVDQLPGVRGATANIHVRRNADTGEWRLSGGGSANLELGGVTGLLSVEIDGEYLSLAADNVSLRRGPLEGHGQFRLSNRPRDASGNPVDGPPTEMRASGHAEASLPLGRYLRGTVGGSFLPNGELEFTGGVALPPSVDLFDRREFNRVLFRPPPLDIPIIGVSAAGQRIGVFATIGGSLSFSAGLGPGQLRDAQLTAAFNPDHPENTTVQGTARFVVPADAGLRLEIHGALGVGIPVISGEAGIELGGALGIVGEASADVSVSWTPQAGLAVEASAHLHAQPQFTFDISTYVRISADILITEIELYNARWTLASYTFGPALAVGVDFPVRWSEQAGLDFDVSAAQVQVPDIDFRALTSDLVSTAVDRG